MKICVTGAAGFIGGHLCDYLKKKGHKVRGVDIVERAAGFSPINADEFLLLDLRRWENALEATRGADWVFGLAADMGGAGFVFTGANDLEIMRNNALININTVEAARQTNVKGYFFSSSACVYPQELQQETIGVPLKESDAYPANPDSAYGWEKLYTEQLLAAYQRATTMKIKIARFHNIFGPQSTWKGGREKFPAAACRKIAQAKLMGTSRIEIWGDGEQIRSYCYVSDLIEMLFRLVNSNYHEPINLGSDRPISCNRVYDILMEIAGITVELHHVPGPTGVRGRNADLSMMKKVLDYECQISLEEGLKRLYEWIEPCVAKALSI